MAKTALIAPRGYMFDENKKLIVRRARFTERGERLTCRFGHDVQKYAKLLEGVVTFWCHFNPTGQKECGACLYVMSAYGGRVFFADMNREETMEIGRGMHSVDTLLAYFGHSLAEFSQPEPSTKD